MDTNDQTPAAKAISAAVAFLAAENGRIERLLEAHRPRPGSDVCITCVATPTRSPCSARRLALMAREFIL